MKLGCTKLYKSQMRRTHWGWCYKKSWLGSVWGNKNEPVVSDIKVTVMHDDVVMAYVFSFLTQSDLDKSYG